MSHERRHFDSIKWVRLLVYATHKSSFAYNIDVNGSGKSVYERFNPQSLHIIVQLDYRIDAIRD